MKKTNKSAVLLLVLLVLVAVSAMYVASTYARYTAEVEGDGTATVAKWAFKGENSTVDFDIDLTTAVKASSLVDGKIAPGTEGKFEIELKNETSDVGVEFTLTLSDIQGAPANLVFNGGADTISGTIAQGETCKVPVEWEWPYHTDATEDAEDTADGIAAGDMTVTVTIDAVQTDPTATVTTTQF